MHYNVRSWESNSLSFTRGGGELRVCALGAPACGVRESVAVALLFFFCEQHILSVYSTSVLGNRRFAIFGARNMFCWRAVDFSFRYVIETSSKLLRCNSSDIFCDVYYTTKEVSAFGAPGRLIEKTPACYYEANKTPYFFCRSSEGTPS